MTTDTEPTFSNDITELRSHLFATLRALRDKQAPMETDRARAIVQTAGALIDSVRAETEFLRVTGNTDGTGFIGTQPVPPPPPPGNGIGAVTRHLIK